MHFGSLELLLLICLVVLAVFFFSSCSMRCCKSNSSGEPYRKLSPIDDELNDAAHSLPYAGGKIIPGDWSLPFAGGSIIPEGTYADKDNIGDF